MTLEEKSEKTVKKLLELTQENEIEWRRVTDTRFLTRGTDDVVDVAYFTEHKSSRFVLYEVKFRSFDMDGMAYWDNDIRVDVRDSEFIIVWSLPRNRMMWDLLRAAQIKAGNAERVMDDFLET